MGPRLCMSPAARPIHHKARLRRPRTASRWTLGNFQTPDWAKHAVWYQIFPERFRNGETSNDPPNIKKWNSSWFSKLPGETGKFYNDVWNRRYGGDIQGIRQELPYLRQLGVNANYLNPIFQAESVHKSDATDYRHIDEHFGIAGDVEQLSGRDG